MKLKWLNLKRSRPPFAPSRGRELKSLTDGISVCALPVRPLAGAGIEIMLVSAF